MEFNRFFRFFKDKSAQPPQFLRITAATNRGLRRPENEDHFCADTIGVGSGRSDVRQHTLGADIMRVFAVFDGMGGEDFGGDCSRIAANTLKETLPKLRSGSAGKLTRLINDYVTDANRRICDMLASRNNAHGGCTMALACIYCGRVNVYSIGDSRVYYYSDDRLRQITDDQTFAAQQIRAGKMTPEEAKHSVASHQLTSFLGFEDYLTVLQPLSYPTFALGDGKLLICSDGLTDMCEDEEIRSLLSAKRENHAQALVNAAIANGGADNVTCIVIEAASFE